MAPTRQEQIKALKEELFDVLVIGGGCVGSGGKLSRWLAAFRVHGSTRAYYTPYRDDRNMFGQG